MSTIIKAFIGLYLIHLTPQIIQHLKRLDEIGTEEFMKELIEKEL